MKTYIKVFSDSSEYKAVAAANAWAEKHNEKIISATLAIRSFKTVSDWYHLTVVFEKEE